MTSSKHRQKLFWLLLLPLMLCACHKEKAYSPTPYEVVIPRYFPTALNIPEDNPMTVEGVELGRKLFYDSKLRGYSGTNPDSMMCCASCHVPDAGFDLGTNNPRLRNGKPVGINGTPTHHNALPLVNLVFNHEGYGWNGGMKSIEEIVGATITDPTEFGSSHARVVATLSADAEYREMFCKAFGTEEVTLDRIEKAVAQYVRTLIDCDSKFDRYLRGEEQLTEQEWRGYVLFTTEEGADCFHCHGSAGHRFSPPTSSTTTLWMQPSATRSTGFPSRATRLTTEPIVPLPCATSPKARPTCTMVATPPSMKYWISTTPGCKTRPTSVR